MSKRVALLLAVVAFGAVLSASVRTDAMGVQPWMLGDYDNVRTYPQMVSDFGHAVRYSFVERYDAASASSLSEGWGMASAADALLGMSLGAVVYEPMAFLGGDWSALLEDGLVDVATIAPLGQEKPQTPQNKCRLIVARQVYRQPLALTIGYAAHKDDRELQNDPAGQQLRWNHSLLATIGLGGRLIGLPLLGRVDWSLSYYYPYLYTLAKDFSYSGTDKVFSRYEEGTSENKLSFDANLLALREDFFKGADMRLLLGMKRHGLKYGEASVVGGLDTAYEVGDTSLYLGGALSHKFDNGATVVLGFKGARDKRSYEAVRSAAGAAVDKGQEEESSLSLTRSLGLEYPLRGWLQLRLGINSDVYLSRSWDVKNGLELNDEAGSGAEIAEDGAALTTGFGLVVENLRVDAQVDQLVYFYGPNYRSAPGLANTERRPIAQLEASYSF